MSGLSGVRALLFPTVLATVAAVLVPSGAHATRGPDGELTQTVPATFEFRAVVQPDQPFYCGSAAFVRWTHVPGATSGTAIYRSRSAYAADTGGPFNDTETTVSGTGTPPFNNTFSFGPTYTVETGYDWIAVNWGAGGSATCTDTAARSRRMVEEAVPPQVRLTIAVPAPTVTKAKRTQRLPGSRWATLGTVQCPAEGACTVKTPRRTWVVVGGKRFPLMVDAPDSLGADQSGQIRVRFTPAARTALAGSQVRPRVRVVATNSGVATTRATVRRTVRR